MTTNAQARLPRYDLILIPLIVVLTLAVLAGLSEFVARQLFVESGSETCSIVGSAGSTVMRPNCISYRKAAEGPETVNVYNNCGYRTPEPCGTRPPGGIRIALMGASTAEGFKVEYPATFAARLSRALTLACRRPVEFQNMGVAGAGLLDMYRRLDEALALKPDMIMLVLTPYEMKIPIQPADLSQRGQPTRFSGTQPGDTPAPLRSLIGRISDLAYNSRILVVAQHFLFQDPATFARLYLLHGEDADYLRVPFRAGWEKRLKDFDLLLGEMADRARAAGVPMMLALGPQRIQTTLLDPAIRPSGTDPFEFGRHLASIASRHGVLFEDTLEGFTTIKNPQSMFYAVDGHMDAAGQGVFAQSVQHKLTKGSPLFKDCPGATVPADP